MKSFFSGFSRALVFRTACLFLILAGCATPPEESILMPEPPFSRFILSHEDGYFSDRRISWHMPEVLPSTGLVATQAWEYDNRIIGVEYRVQGGDQEISMTPVNVPEAARQSGTVTVNLYPAGYGAEATPASIRFSSVLDLTGLGHGRPHPEEEFWEYQRALEEENYNLHKLVKLFDADAPRNEFHSLLVLKKLSGEKTDAIVLTLGRSGDVHTLITIRKYVRNRQELDAFGVWAYDILRDFGLTAR